MNLLPKGLREIYIRPGEKGETDRRREISTVIVQPTEPPPSPLLPHEQIFNESSIGGFAVTVRSVCIRVFLKSLADSGTVSFSFA